MEYKEFHQSIQLAKYKARKDWNDSCENNNPYLQGTLQHDAYEIQFEKLEMREQLS